MQLQLFVPTSHLFSNKPPETYFSLSKKPKVRYVVQVVSDNPSRIKKRLFVGIIIMLKKSLIGSSVGLGSCLIKGGGLRFEPPGGHWGIPQFTGKAYPVCSPGALRDYGDA